MAKLVLFGTQKMAQIAHFHFTHDSPHEVVAFTVDRSHLSEERFLGLPVVPFEDVQDVYPPGEYKLFIAVGYTKLNSTRADRYIQAKAKGYKLVSYLCSRASHWGDTKIGENCFILENQVIQPFVSIGDNVVLWSGNHFGHDVVIGDHVWVSSHVVVSGDVEIGERSFIGVNVTIGDGVKIGRECIIGAGALMMTDAEDREVYVPRSTEKYRLDSHRFEMMMEMARRQK